MSQRSRPDSSQAANDPPRMPIEAAEALLWGKETLNQQTFLYSRMRNIEDQHRSYETRIQSTEAIAEAAEAATSRIRSIEQKVAAIESDEHDRPFDKWAEGEIESFKVFAEKNKNVRQKQIEFERQLSGIEDHVDKNKDTSRDVEILLHRIERLENDRMNDATSIKRLERDVTNFTVMHQNQALEIDQLRSKMTPKQNAMQMLPLPSRQRHADTSDQTDQTDYTMNVTRSPIETICRHTPQQLMLLPPTQRSAEAFNVTGYVMECNKRPVETTRRPTLKHMMLPPSNQQDAEGSETEDENFVTTHENKQTDREQIQVPRSPEVNQKSSSSVFVSSPTKGRDAMSARLRMMQRKSIHDPKRSRDNEPQRSGVPAPRPKSRNGPRPDQLPATQLINRSNNAMPMHAEERPPRIPDPTPPTQLIVKLKTSKRKLEEHAPCPRLTRSQAKKNRETFRVEPKALMSRKIMPTVETQLAKGPASKRRKPNDPRAPPQTGPKKKDIERVPQATPNAANLVKTSPRKAAAGKQRESCDPCNRLHTACDNVRPICGNCRNRPQRGSCVYPSKLAGNSVQLPIPLPPNPWRKEAEGKGRATPIRAGDGFDTAQNDIRSSSKTMSQEKLQPSAKSPKKHGRPLAGSKDISTATSGISNPPPSSAARDVNNQAA